MKLEQERAPVSAVRCALTARYRFSAAHRLDTPALTPEQNRALYGKCNNPFGHGHNYSVDITVEGPVDANGQVAHRGEMDRLVHNAVLSQLDHKDLNRDVPEFTSAVATTENLAEVIHSRLAQQWTLPARLVRIRIAETDRNSFVWEASGGSSAA